MGQSVGLRNEPGSVEYDENDGRRRVAWLPELVIEGTDSPVIQVVAEAGGEILYTLRARATFSAACLFGGSFTVKVGRNRPDGTSLTGLKASASRDAAGTRTITL